MNDPNSNGRLSESERHARVLEAWHDRDTAEIADLVGELAGRIGALDKQQERLIEHINLQTERLNQVAQHINALTDRINQMVHMMSQQQDVLRAVADLPAKMLRVASSNADPRPPPPSSPRKLGGRRKAKEEERDV